MTCGRTAHRTMGILLVAAIISSIGCGSTRFIKRHDNTLNSLNGQIVAGESRYSESITVCKAPKVRSYPPLLINLLIMPVISQTGPWANTLIASQKKTVLYYSLENELLKQSNVEISVRLKFKNPMMIAQSLYHQGYITEVFDYIWERVETDMANQTGISVYNADEATIPVIETGRSYVPRPLVSTTDLPDTDNGFLSADRLYIRDATDDVFIEPGNQKMNEWNSAQLELNRMLQVYKIGSVDVRLWAETVTPDGKRIAWQERNFTVQKTKTKPDLEYLNLN